MENPHFGSDQEKEKDVSLAPLKDSQIEEEVGSGSFSRVYNVSKSDGTSSGMVVKIGETKEFTVPLLKVLKLKLPREKVSVLLKVVLGKEFEIMPMKEMTKNGVAEYLLMKEYFGGNDQNRVEEEMNSASKKQRNDLLDIFQDKESELYQSILAILGDEESMGHVMHIVDQYQNENFLPKEQTVVGHPPSLTRADAQKLEAKGKELPTTFYIFQDRIQGDNVVHLSELSDQDLSDHPDIVKRLLLFAILTKKMYEDTGKLIDTRPAGILGLEWFQETENIFVDKDTQKVYFIDTRLLWDKDTRIIGKKGLNIIERFGIGSIDQAIKKYAKLSQETTK